MKIEIKVLNKHFYEENALPHYQTSGSAAMDLYCTEDVRIYPGETNIIATGIAIHINNDSIAAVILPRSGLGTRGLVLANTIGLIDSDYQGELKIAAWNRNQYNPDESIDGIGSTENLLNTINLKAGDRIAQLIFIPIIKPEFKLVDEFSSVTARGQGGFGHTGG